MARDGVLRIRCSGQCMRYRMDVDKNIEGRLTWARRHGRIVTLRHQCITPAAKTTSACLSEFLYRWQASCVLCTSFILTVSAQTSPYVALPSLANPHL